MKLRIKGNSIRIRLTKSEAAQIARGNAVSEVLSFGAGVRLIYSLVPSLEVVQVQAKFDQGEIQILSPFGQSKRWAASNEIFMKGSQPLQEGGELSLLVEKDFFCLKPRVNEIEDESDLFENPNEAHGSCG